MDRVEKEKYVRSSRGVEIVYLAVGSHDLLVRVKILSCPSLMEFVLLHDLPFAPVGCHELWDPIEEIVGYPTVGFKSRDALLVPKSCRFA